MKHAEVLVHGMLQDCTFMMLTRSQNPNLGLWKHRREQPSHSVLVVVIGGVELRDGGEYLVICDEKRYTVRVEMALGFSNHCRIVTEWPDAEVASGGP